MTARPITRSSGTPAAEPTTPPNEGCSPTLDTSRKNLEAASAGYAEAQNGLEVSKGRACDLAAASSGFGGTATGGDRTNHVHVSIY